MLFRPKLLLARAAGAVSRTARTGGGTAVPGKLLLRLAPDGLERLGRRLPEGTVLLSATNGKTTTAKMAAAILEPHVRLCRNAAGANLASGVASALLDPRGARIGLFEVDEAALPQVAAALRPRVLGLGNLFRDQLDRYGELELVAERWRAVVRALDSDALLVRNADDPLVASLGDGRSKVVSYGVDDPRIALPAMQHAADSKWCVRCGARYLYDAVYLGHLGAWRCPSCGTARPALDVVARDVRHEALEAVSFTLAAAGGEARVRLPVPGLYNVYNALAAAALAAALAPLEAASLAAGLERFSAAFGRFERLLVDGREVVLLLVKNPAGANEVIRTLGQDAAPKTLLIALNDRTADGRDVSWIWDVDFELLTGLVERTVVTGTRAAEMGMRLKYAGIDRRRIEVLPALDAALDRCLAAGGGPAYLLATYTAMLDLRGLLVGRGLLRPYWEAA
jgi:lipid II isoglutaminyl synthase (glutamine-hydrolysing)